MAVFTNFEQLDDLIFFSEFIKSHYEENDWNGVLEPVGVKPLADRNRLTLAHELYKSNLSEVRVRLHSQNPDHYKRAACLLDALNRAQVMQGFEYGGHSRESLEAGGILGLSHDDCQFRIKFLDFFEGNGNQLIAFDAAFRCCQTYEESDKPYSPNYLENMVHYLGEYDAQNVGSLYMIFKSYWV
jgi:hypothetical protein